MKFGEALIIYILFHCIFFIGFYEQYGKLLYLDKHNRSLKLRKATLLNTTFKLSWLIQIKKYKVAIYFVAYLRWVIRVIYHPPPPKPFIFIFRICIEECIDLLLYILRTKRIYIFYICTYIALIGMG